jgi:hypothetical protein
MGEGSVDAHVAQIKPHSEAGRKAKPLKVNDIKAGA